MQNRIVIKTSCRWEFIPMKIKAISISIKAVSHSFPFPILSLISIPMGFPWDSHSNWKSHSYVYEIPAASKLKQIGRGEKLKFSDI